MDFDPTEIKRMMEKRQRELRGNRPVPEDALSPSKKSRQEKENEAVATSSPQKQGFMAKFAVSPKNPRRDTAATLSQASPSTRARLNEVSKRYAELEDEFPKRSSSPGAPTTPKKKAAPQPTTTPKAQKKRAPSPPSSNSVEAMDTGEVRKKWEITERTTVTVTHKEQNRPVEVKVSTSTRKVDPSETNVAQRAKKFDKPEQGSQDQKSSTLPKSKVVPRGKIADKISKFDVGSSGPRCEIDTKPMASVSARAKFFEKAMEADKKAADAVYVPVNQRTSKYIEQKQQASNERVLVVPTKPVVCNTVVSPRKRKDPCKDQAPPEEDSAEPAQSHDYASESSEDDVEEDDRPLGAQLEPEPLRSEQFEPPRSEESVPKKVGTVSSKLKNRLQDLMVNGHQTPDDTLMSISEKFEEHPLQSLGRLAEEPDEDQSECQPEDELLLSPQIVKKSEKFMDDDTISRITGIPEDGHSTPKPCTSSAENLGTPLRKTMSQYRRDEREAQQREANVQRIVYQIPSNMMQEIRRGKEEEVNDEGALKSYKRQMEEEMAKQESIMKQTSHALMVCQENGDKGSEQQVEAERLLLIATQRHHVAQSELQRINVAKSVPHSGGTLTICDIKLPYKNEFLKLMRQSNDILESTHYFIVLVRSGASLLHTELVSTNEKILGGSVSLNHHMVLKNLQDGFRVFVDVYAVQALNRNHPDYEATIKKIRREKEKESNKGGGILSAFTPSKKKTQGTPHVEEVKIRKPSFGLIGRVTLDEGLIALDKQVHYLDNYFNESPLDGRIYMKIQLNMPDKVHHCGMLRLKDSNGFMSSFFAAVEGSHLNLWNDIRSAEDGQEPLRSFELSQAVDIVRVEQSFSFYYFPLKLSGGVELQFLTYAEDESNKWADKLNACITRYSKH